MIQVSNLLKTYKKQKHPAVNNLNLNISEGEKVALLGCNGAGKTTLIQLLLGLLTPTSGEVQILNQTPPSLELKKNVTYLPQFLAYPEHLKVSEIISTVSSHFDKLSDTVNLADFELNTLSSREAYTLSGGEMRKLGVFLTLIRDSSLTIMDEPTANVDLIGKSKIYAALEKCLKDPKKTFVFSSHEMSEVERLATRVIVLNEGSVVANGSVDEIKEIFGLHKIQFRSQFKNLNLNFIEKLESHQSLNTIYTKEVTKTLKEIFQQTEDIHDLKVSDPSLEEIFLKLWGKKSNDSSEEGTQ